MLESEFENKFKECVKIFSDDVISSIKRDFPNDTISKIFMRFYDFIGEECFDFIIITDTSFKETYRQFVDGTLRYNWNNKIATELYLDDWEMYTKSELLKTKINNFSYLNCLTEYMEFEMGLGVEIQNRFLNELEKNIRSEINIANDFKFLIADPL